MLAFLGFEKQLQVEPGSLGSVQVTNGPAACVEDLEKTCYLIQVDCRQVGHPIQARLRVGEPLSAKSRGTLFLTTGWIGNYFWGDEDKLSPIEAAWADPTALTPPKAILRLREDGFRTVELMWETNWFQAETGRRTGLVNLACRPATVARWVYDHLHREGQSQPYCMSGHSNGASQVAYALADYGLSQLVSGVVFESGPNWTKLENTCLHIDQEYAGAFGDFYERSDLDWTYGYPMAGTGNCATQNIQHLYRFRRDSVAYGDPQEFAYPHVQISFLIGGEDTSATAFQALNYYHFLVEQGNSHVALKTVPGVGHWFIKDADGAPFVVDAIEQSCVLNPAKP